MKKLLVLVSTIIVITISSCSDGRHRNHSEQQVSNDLVELNTLMRGRIQQGIHSFEYDNVEYVIVKTGNSGQGIAIIKHK